MPRRPPAHFRLPRIRVEKKTGNLLVDFTWQNLRVQPSTGDKDTPEAREALEQQLLSMSWHMNKGTFVPTDWFPESRSVWRTFRPDGAPGTNGPNDAPPLFGPWLRHWHEARCPFEPDGSVSKNYEIAPTTWLHDRATVNLLIAWFGEDRPLEEITRPLCLQFRKFLQETPIPGRKRPRMLKTVRSILGLLHCAFEDLLEGDDTKQNPVPPAGKRGAKRRMREDRRNEVLRAGNPLSVDQLYLFLDSLPEIVRLVDGATINRTTLVDLYTVWVRTGLRSNEPFALRFRNLDFEKGGFWLTQARSPKLGGIETDPKTGVRWVDCSGDPEIFAAFSRRRRAVGVARPDAYVFSDSRDRPLSQDVLYRRVWKPTLAAAGIPHRTQNDGMRDTWISHALDAGEQMAFIAQRTGTSPKMIHEHYLGRIDNHGDGKRVAASLDRANADSVRTVSERAEDDLPGRAGRSPQAVARTAKSAARHRAKRSGGGGNRTPVRRHSTKSHYTLSSRFDLTGPAPMSGLRSGQPGKFKTRASWRQRGSDPN